MQPLSRTRAAALALAGAFAASLLSASPASAGPACSSLSVSLASFESCVADGQDTIANVQAALNDALIDSVTLIPFLSYYPGAPDPVKAGDEFEGQVPGLFEFTPADFENNITFTFTVLPPETVFLTMKAGNAFEIFYLPNTGTTDLTHQLTPDSTSHFSTFAALVPIQVPEPASLAMLGGALIGFGLLRRRKRT